MALVDMVDSNEEKKVMRESAIHTGRKWLSQVTAASGKTVLQVSGVPNRHKWKKTSGRKDENPSRVVKEHVLVSRS